MNSPANLSLTYYTTCASIKSMKITYKPSTHQVPVKVGYSATDIEFLIDNQLDALLYFAQISYCYKCLDRTKWDGEVRGLCHRCV